MPLPEKVKAYAETIPIKQRNSYLRTMAGKSSPRQAIKIHCWDCVNYDKNQLIPDCGIPTCPLFAYRPVLKASKKPAT